MSADSPEAGVDYYELLGVSVDASTEEIEAAWKQQMKLHHPDRGGDEEHSKLINAAHDTLADPHQRALYDGRRASGGAAGAGGDGATVGDEVWDDWDDFATSAAQGGTTWVAASASAPADVEADAPPMPPVPTSRPSRWRRGMTRPERVLTLILNVLLVAVIVGVAWWLVVRISDQSAGFEQVEGSADGVAILAALVVPSVLLLLGLGAHTLGLAQRWQRARRSPFPPLVRPTGGTAFLLVSLVLVVSVAGVAAPGLVGGDGFGAVAVQVAQAQEIEKAEAVAAEAREDGLSGLPSEPVACVLGRNDRGWPLPDPECTPGTVAEVTRAQICSGKYRPKRPSGDTINLAQAAVAESYSSSEAPIEPDDVVFLVPIRLGGSWDAGNLWPRGALVKDTTVDAVIDRLCEPGSTLTLREVQAAARVNDLAGLLKSP
jgi:hypothetical protein